MTKTATATDPFAAVRKALLDSVETVTAQQRQAAAQAQAEFVKAKDMATAQAQAEFVKAKDMATAQAEKAQTAVQANVDAAVAASEVVTAGAEKMAELMQGELARVTDNRVAAVKKLIGATSLQDVVAVQSELLKAEQGEAKAFVETVAELTREVTTEAAKPVQAQAAETIKAFAIKAA